MDFNLEGKGVAITGGSKGIGRAAAFAFARQGANVAIAARGQEELDRTCEEISRETGRKVVGFAGDLMDGEQVKRFVDGAAEALGRLDILVNCAGSAPAGDFLTLPDDAWIQAFSLKFMGAVRAARAAIPHFRQTGGGVVVNVAGAAGKEPAPTMMTAGFNNAAMMNFTKAFSHAYGKENIRAVVIAPGMVNTGRFVSLRNATAQVWGVDADEADRRMKAGVPLGRISEPEDVANLIVFVASDTGRMLTGVEITIDGGATRAL
jgi:3-oxoacyl-[acyl-carrier protein] reductase